MTIKTRNGVGQILTLSAGYRHARRLVL